MVRSSRWIALAVILLAWVPMGCQPVDASKAEDAPPKFAENRVGQTQPAVKSNPPGFAEDRLPKDAPKAVPFDGERAMKYLKSICDIGPRISNTEGMKKQQTLLIKHFEDLGGKVTKQEFQAKQRSQKAAVPMMNLIVSWYPERKDRIILCAHYDTRPQADQEPNRRNWNRPFVSANDGTSGVAMFMELAHHMKDLQTTVGVDFVIFDGEEYVFTGPSGTDDFFLGSEYFAQNYDKTKKDLPYRYSAAILFDLFAHENARLAVEGYSWASGRRLIEEIWGIADKLAIKTFKYERGFDRGADVLDDHIALQAVGIPAIDIIDFDYKHWHKLTDTPDQCSAKQFENVAKVITTWLQSKK